jgi:hypothetical protein
MRMQQIGSWPPAVFAPPQKADMVRRPKDEGQRRRAFAGEGAASPEPDAETTEDAKHDKIDIVV